jgi:hypothetical protein
MKPDHDFDLARVREARIQISREFGNDPDLLARHYMELQRRHADRLVHSSEMNADELPLEAR